MKPLTQRINQFVDHTLLKPDAAVADIRKFVREAHDFQFWAVCINPYWVSFVRQELRQSPVKIATVIGFPLGANVTAAKVFETENAVRSGADEIDMVMAIGAAKSGDWQFVEDDIRAVVMAANGKIVKVILETCLLSDAEKIHSCQLAVRAGARFVKTSTGFAASGATVGDVQLLRRTVGPDFGVKASGGMRTLADMEQMLKAGANRLGTSSAVQALRQESITESY